MKTLLPTLLLSLALGGSGEHLDAARTIWEGWREVAKPEKAYSAAPVAKERVLLWVPKGSSRSKLKKTSEKTVKLFDALFEDAPHVEGATPRTAVLFELVGPKSLEAATGHAAAQVPRLAGWAASARSGTGFVLEEPLAAGWMKSVSGVEVWSPENELANRLARLLTLERFGRQPHWLAQGLAWHLEIGVCKDVYCFPYRTGFVSKKEHRSWPRMLADQMEARGERPVEMAELAGWRRNSWDAPRAGLAWGAATMLAEHYEDELPRVLAAFAALRVKDGRDVAADGSWTWIPDHEIPAEGQLELLDRELGVDFLTELGRFARKPKRYRRPR